MEVIAAVGACATGTVAAIAALRLLTGAWRDLHTTTEDLSDRLEHMRASLHGAPPPSAPGRPRLH